ncbi:hypothetical protein ABBQ38_001876 [Trebouxia sp. C0009 RCD-2024]
MNTWCAYMDRTHRKLQDQAAHLSTTTQVLDDLLATVERFHYQAWPEDIQAMKDYKTEERKLPKSELTVGALGGFLLGSVIKQRTGAIILGLLLGYQAQDRQRSLDHGMQRLLALPTPLGAELVEIVKMRDATYPLLNQLPHRDAWPERIATPDALVHIQRDLDSEAEHQEHTQDSMMQGNGLWAWSDPFDLCFGQPVNVSVPNAAKGAVRRRKAETQKQQRQEVYRARQRACKQCEEAPFV